MRIDILTLFPNLFEGAFTESIIKRCVEKGLVTINIYNFRDYTNDPHGNVDDTPFGGGAGMVLACQPIFDCVNSIKTDESKVILMTPRGKTYNQSMAVDLSHEKHLILICGHYEGFDERIRSLCDMEISIGDYVLTGGEIPAMILVDSITRLLDGAITSESLSSESFTDNLLDYPTYTKPRVYNNIEVPEILLSGDHKKIDEYRQSERERVTRLYRPDLWERYNEDNR